MLLASLVLLSSPLAGTPQAEPSALTPRRIEAQETGQKEAIRGSESGKGQKDTGAPSRRQRFGRGAQASGEKVWKLLAEKYDKDKDGRVTREEYPREKQKFEAYDRNGDGVLNQEDFASSGRSARRRGARRSGGRRMDPGRIFHFLLLRFADDDGSRSISKKEWKAVRTELASGEPMQGMRARMQQAALRFLDKDKDGKLSGKELGGWFGKADINGDGKVTRAELLGTRGQNKLPTRGELAPDFELPFVKDSKKTVRLSSFAGKKAVALIFGSYT